MIWISDMTKTLNGVSRSGSENAGQTKKLAPEPDMSNKHITKIAFLYNYGIIYMLCSFSNLAPLTNTHRQACGFLRQKFYDIRNRGKP